jgi:hypothetical protein
MRHVIVEKIERFFPRDGWELLNSETKEVHTFPFKRNKVPEEEC